MMMSHLPGNKGPMQGGVSLMAYQDPSASPRSELILFVRTVILFGQNADLFPSEC